jgi:hypothetical protein
VLILANHIFSAKVWNNVPQFYTYAGKWPDLVFERFYHRPGQYREAAFVAQVFLEFKTKTSPDDPIEQLKNSVLQEYGILCSSKGFLIGIKGVHWRIVEYHFVVVPNKATPELLLVDFHDFTRGPARENGRPVPSREHTVGEYMDFNKQSEGKDIIEALLWISKGKKGRDLTFTRKHASTLPESFTRSTLDMGLIVETDADNPHKLGNEYDYLIPLLNQIGALQMIPHKSLWRWNIKSKGFVRESLVQ